MSQTLDVPKGTVVIVGGGPVGLILARVLSFYGVKSKLFERNRTTTSWPKMDLTNARSMEFFRKLGLADDLRTFGVPSHFDQDVLISTGLSAETPITKWRLPSVDKFRKIIREKNDGTQPVEPWQRLSQALFEKWLKSVCDEDPLIDLNYGHRVESVKEETGRVIFSVTNSKTGGNTTWRSEYLVGCDGASSQVRRSLGYTLEGGPIPACALLVHFKSRDLTRLHKQGRFWHIFFVGESGGFQGVIIAQDEKDTWTVHLFMPADTDLTKLDPHETVYRVLGGLYGEYRVDIDEVLVSSIWTPHIAVANDWATPSRLVFLAGDAAHQNIPTGGYGMNMGIGDAFDLGWKLASVVKGEAGTALLSSYEMERKPVALRNVQHSGVHFDVHTQLQQFLAGGDPRRVDSGSDTGHALRQNIHQYYQEHDGENKDMGIEMGYVYESPFIVREDYDIKKPEWSPRQYLPTTWPGSRVPHIFLSDGSAIFDHFGREWTLLVFSCHDVGQQYLLTAAQQLSIPVTEINLSHESQAVQLYEMSLVLVRPDHHVCWRSNAIHSLEAAGRVLRTISGKSLCADLEQHGRAWYLEIWSRIWNLVC